MERNRISATHADQGSNQGLKQQFVGGPLTRNVRNGDNTWSDEPIQPCFTYHMAETGDLSHAAKLPMYNIFQRNKYTAGVVLFAAANKSGG